MIGISAGVVSSTSTRSSVTNSTTIPTKSLTLNGIPLTLGPSGPFLTLGS